MRKHFCYPAILVAILSLTIAQTHGQEAELSESALDFGNVAIGATGEEMVTVTNVSASGEGMIVSATCNTGTGFSTNWTGFAGVSYGFSVDVEVSFNPLTNGDSTDVLVIEIRNQNGDFVKNMEVDLIGTGGDSSDPVDLIEDILTSFDESIANGTLVSTGNHPNRRHRALRNRLKAIGYLIDQGYYSHASYITHTAILRTDGQPHPKDFVEGSGLQELNDSLVLLQVLLDS